LNRIPTLDGWRGIAILLVLFEHIGLSWFGGYSQPWLLTGQHGVTIFFVLSGFLITTKLLVSPIDLKQFYIRRFFRLMPAARAVLCAQALWGIRLLRIPVAALTGLIIFPTMTTGWHYFCDVLAGIVLAVSAMVITEWLSRRLAQLSPDTINMSQPPLPE
jgi:peptidoglycan/LPS O-acetylase OafA/YrhL